MASETRLSLKLEELNKKLSILERNTLVFYGLPNVGGNIRTSEIWEQVSNLLGVDLKGADIDDIFFLGKQ